MWALLPIKVFARAKMRLSGILTDAERAGLARAMAEDVLATVCDAPGIDRVYVVTAELEAEALAARNGARSLPEGDIELGLNGAVGRAFLKLAAEGAESVVVIHSDLPLLSRFELAAVIESHDRGGARSVCVVPDRRREGTNLLAVRPPAAIRPQYGAASFRHHCEQARSLGAAVDICELAGGGLDIDLPEDVVALVTDGSAGAPKSKAFLAASGISARIPSEQKRKLALVAGSHRPGSHR